MARDDSTVAHQELCVANEEKTKGEWLSCYGELSISDAALIILNHALPGDTSGLDGDTGTWSESTAAELTGSISAIWNSVDFGLELVSAMAASRREVSLLAVELTALALLPLSHPDRALCALFDQLVDAVAGPPLIVPSALLRAVSGPGFRSAGGDDDTLPARLLYLTEYVKISGTCPAYDALVEQGHAEYLGHDDLHNRCPGELITETPWACVEFSGLVNNDNLGMRYDLDHMLWPDFLAPPAIREAAESIREEHADLLQGDFNDSVIAVQKDLYLLKQLVGSWGELTTKWR